MITDREKEWNKRLFRKYSIIALIIMNKIIHYLSQKACIRKSNEKTKWSSNSPNKVVCFFLISIVPYFIAIQISFGFIGKAISCISLMITYAKLFIQYKWLKLDMRKIKFWLDLYGRFASRVLPLCKDQFLYVFLPRIF